MERDRIIKEIQKAALSPGDFLKLPRMAQIDVILHSCNGEVELKELKETTLQKIYKIINNEPKNRSKKNI